MRYVGFAAAGLTLSAVVFSSCTCHKETSPPPTVQAPPSGFHAAGPKVTPQMRVQATLPPTQAAPQVAAAGASPTPAADMPADFPKDVPIYKDAAVSKVQNLPNNAHNVIFSTSDQIPNVTSFYQQKMTSAGWKITEQFQRENHAFFKFEKGKMVANLTVAQDMQNPGKQIIAIMYEEQQPLPFDEF